MSYRTDIGTRDHRPGKAFEPLRVLLAVLVGVLVHGCGGSGKAPVHPRPRLDTISWKKELDSLRLHMENDPERQLAFARWIYAQTRGVDSLARQQAAALSCIAGALFEQHGDYDTALAIQREAVRIAETAGDSSTLGRMVMGLGALSEERGDHVAAMAAYLRSLRIREALGDEVGMGRLMNNIGKLYWEQDDLPAAMDMARRSIAIKQRLDSAFLNESLNALGLYMLDAKRPDTAAILFKQSIPLMERFHGEYGTSMERDNLGLAYKDMGRMDSALLMFHAAVEEGRKAGDEVGAAYAYMNYGDALVKLGRYKEAGALLDSGMALARSNDLPEVTMELHGSLSEQRERAGQATVALAHARMYQQMHDSLMGVEKEAQMNELRVRYETDKKNRENQQLRAAQEVAELRAERGRWIAIGAALLALVVGVLSWTLLQRNRERARRREEDLEQQAMRLQMDPHFLFNALNTIPGLYASGDPGHANDHVGHLSKFLRLVLETSRKRTIALSQELELVENYLHICANRRPGSFTWSIDVSPDVHAERVAVPPMLVQPVVENALEHGLRGVEHGGHIAVSVERAGDEVTVTVRDNGIGRTAAAQWRTGREGASLGLGLVRERLRILGQGARRGDPVEVRDEQQPDGTPTGTTVTLHLRNTDLRHHVTRSDR